MTRTILATLLVALWAGSAWASTAQVTTALTEANEEAAGEEEEDTTPTLDEVIAGVERKYEKIRHMRMDFRQILRRKADPRTRRASGKIEFLRPGKMRWQYERPERVLYVSDGDVLWSYQPEDALVYKARIEGSRLYHALRFLFGIGDLRESFEITMGPAHGPETAYLVLTPKDGHQDYKELALVLDRESFEISESFLVDPLGNVTHYIFDNRDYETPVAPERFKFSPPPGVSVQEL